MSLHEHLLAIVKKLPSDFEPYGERDRDAEWGSDCSCGCRHFIPLHGALGADWGICANPASPRGGLLTFEHQGCHQFESEDEPEETTADGAAQGLVELPTQPLPGPASATRKRVKIDLDEFIMALEGFPSGEVTYVLDLANGKVVPLFEDDDEYEELGEQIDSDPNRYHHIEQLDSHESFRIMEDFTAALPESTVKDALLNALSRNKPFRRFKEIVHDDLALRDRWFSFREDAIARLVGDMLSVQGIEVEWIRR